MANELKYTYGSQVTLEASGASAASSAMVAADDANLDSSNHSNYPLGDFVLKCDFAAAVGNQYAVYLYRRDHNIDSTNDAPAPAASTYEQVLVGIFAIPSGQSAAAYYPCNNVPLSKECQFYIKNGTNQSMSAGWTLKVTPKTYWPSS